MAYFAELNENNIVLRVVVIDDKYEQEGKGKLRRSRNSFGCGGRGRHCGVEGNAERAGRECFRSVAVGRRDSKACEHVDAGRPRVVGSVWN